MTGLLPGKDCNHPAHFDVGLGVEFKVEAPWSAAAKIHMLCVKISWTEFAGIHAKRSREDQTAIHPYIAIQITTYIAAYLIPDHAITQI